MTDDDFSERVHASVARFLIEGGEYEAANVILACTLYLNIDGQSYGDEVTDVEVILKANRRVYDTLSDRGFNSPWSAIISALHAVLSTHWRITNITTGTAVIDKLDPNWKQDLREIAQGRKVHNQGTTRDDNIIPIHYWNGLLFRSKSEVKIAEELDRLGVLFLPNCRARLGRKPSRSNREADFLICYKGKWGIIEVDGEIFHPSAAKDHDRDRLFREHGFMVIEHFTDKECFNDPTGVVRRFLSILSSSS